MAQFAIAGIQMQVSATTSNVAEMRRQLDVALARFPWVQMVLFSELAALGPLTHNAQPMPGPLEHEFCELALRHGIWLLPGTIFESSEGRVFNTAAVIDPTGRVVGRYRKMFPFQPYEQGVDAGDSFLVFDVPGVGRFGVSICYDMWFPETSRTLAAMGAEVILHPSLTDTIDRDVELSIARATAAINQCYVFDINGVGDGGYGRSIVTAPSGRTVYEAGSAPEVIPVEIDLARVRRERLHGVRQLGQPLKSFRDRRVDFTVYRPQAFDNSYLDSLGPLQAPTRRPPVPAAGDAATTPAGEPAAPAEATADWAAAARRHGGAV